MFGLFYVSWFSYDEAFYVFGYSSDEVCFMKSDGRLEYRIGGSTDQHNVTLSECRGQEVKIGELYWVKFYLEVISCS